MMQGTIKHWNSDPGFGFLKRDDGEGDVFVHIRSLESVGLPEPQIGDRLAFEIVLGCNGKTEAGNLRRVFA
jgi:CspA family cold shock protein